METTGSEIVRAGQCIVVERMEGSRTRAMDDRGLSRIVSPISTLVPKIVFNKERIEVVRSFHAVLDLVNFVVSIQLATRDHLGRMNDGNNVTFPCIPSVKLLSCPWSSHKFVKKKEKTNMWKICKTTAEF